MGVKFRGRVLRRGARQWEKPAGRRRLFGSREGRSEPSRFGHGQWCRLTRGFNGWPSSGRNDGPRRRDDRRTHNNRSHGRWTVEARITGRSTGRCTDRGASSAVSPSPAPATMPEMAATRGQLAREHDEPQPGGASNHDVTSISFQVRPGWEQAPSWASGRAGGSSPKAPQRR